jgi:hypothetical protein
VAVGHDRERTTGAITLDPFGSTDSAFSAGLYHPMTVADPASHVERLPPFIITLGLSPSPKIILQAWSQIVFQNLIKVSCDIAVTIKI